MTDNNQPPVPPEPEHGQPSAQPQQPAEPQGQPQAQPQQPSQPQAQPQAQPQQAPQSQGQPQQPYGQQPYPPQGYQQQPQQPYGQPGYQQAPPPGYQQGYPQPGYQQAPPPGYGQPYDPYAKNRLVAGLLGIFLGSLGIHRFYLGYTGIGIAQIIVTFVTFGVGALWGFIEGIMILARAQSFNTDAEGRPLRD